MVHGYGHNDGNTRNEETTKRDRERGETADCDIIRNVRWGISIISRQKSGGDERERAVTNSQDAKR